jgi:hypothetical protein
MPSAPKASVRQSGRLERYLVNVYLRINHTIASFQVLIKT